MSPTFMIEKYAPYRRNEAAEFASGVRDAISQEPRSFETFARDYAAMRSLNAVEVKTAILRLIVLGGVRF